MKKLIFAFGVWTSILSLFALGSVKLTGVQSDLAQMIRDYAFDLVVINTCIMTALQGYPSAPDIKLPDGMKRAFALALVLGAAFLMPSDAFAADVASKAPTYNPFAQPYDIGKCGAYFGINTMGSTSAVNSASATPGTQVVQGAIGGTLGYGCPINTANGSFWFVEVMADINNFNGATNGLSLAGPASFVERFGVGSPLHQLIGLIPGLGSGSASSPAVPNLPALPNGITAGAGNPYAFFALHQDDFSYQLGLAQNQQWLISYGVGLGILYRLSNGVVADTFAEYNTPSNSLCLGPLGGGACAKKGQGARVGIAFKY